MNVRSRKQKLGYLDESILHLDLLENIIRARRSREILPSAGHLTIRKILTTLYVGFGTKMATVSRAIAATMFMVITATYQ